MSLPGPVNKADTEAATISSLNQTGEMASLSVTYCTVAHGDSCAPQARYGSCSYASYYSFNVHSIFLPSIFDTQDLLDDHQHQPVSPTEVIGVGEGFKYPLIPTRMNVGYRFNSSYVYLAINATPSSIKIMINFNVKHGHVMGPMKRHRISRNSLLV